MSDPAVQLRNTYELLEPTAAAVTQLLELSHSLLGKDCNLSLRVRFAGLPERTVTYADEQTFVAAMSASPRGFTISGSQAARGIWASWDARGALDFNATGPDEPTAAAVLADLELRLHLVQSSSTRPRMFVVEGLYSFLSPPHADWLPAILPDLLRPLGTPDYSNGEFRHPSTPHLRQGVPDLDTWLNSVKPEWDQILEWNLSFTNLPRRLSLSYAKSRSQLRVQAEAPVEAEVTACFACLEGRGDLARVNNFISTEQSRGRFRRFFLKQEPQPAWVDRFVALTAALTGPRFGFNGKFRSLPPERLESSFGNLKEWRTRLDSEWRTLSSLSCWLSGPAGSINMDLDLRRDLLGINLQTNANEDLGALFQQLQNSLDLSEAIDAPYKYRQFARRYTIGGWTTNAKFADAVAGAVKIAFKGRAPALERAYLARGGPQEDGESFYDWDSLDRALRGSDPYSQTHLVFEGTNGHFLGVHLEENRTELNLLANLDRSDFTDVVKQFRDALDEVSLKSDDDDKKKESKPSTAPAWLAAGAAALGACLTFIAAGPVMTWLREAPKIRIVEPLKPTDGKSVAVDSGGFNVRWQYTTPTFRRGDRVDYRAPATVSVERYADGTNIVPAVLHRGNAHIAPLPPGDYLVVVSTPDGLQDETHITVPTIHY